MKRGCAAWKYKNENHAMMKQRSGKTKIIPHSRPTLGQAEIESVSRVMATSHIAQGQVVYDFEQAFAEYLGVKSAACTSSGTAALHLVLKAMGIGEQDEVVIPSYVCTALLNSVEYVGAKPILAEIDPDTYNLDPKDVKGRLSSRTKAIIVPHLFGLPADIDGLLALNIPIIEDCAQAVGSTYRQHFTGTFGKAAIFSFYATKVMTTGEGGMVISNSKDLIDRVKDLREYDHKDEYLVRYNYKMTDIHAAIGMVQLDRIKTFLRRRRDIAELYNQAFDSFGLQLPPQNKGHIYYRYVIGLGTDAEVLAKTLQNQGIGCARPVFLPLHRYLNLKGYYQTENAWEQALSIPIYPSLSTQDIDRLIDRCTETFRKMA
jgi:perosamine synthetase